MSLDYAINKYPQPQDTEIKEIAKQWNKDNAKFVWDLDGSIVFMFYHYSYFLSICRTGSFVVEWLIEKLNNDDKHYDALQLNLDRIEIFFLYIYSMNNRFCISYLYIFDRIDHCLISTLCLFRVTKHRVAMD